MKTYILQDKDFLLEANTSEIEAKYEVKYISEAEYNSEIRYESAQVDTDHSENIH